MNVIDKRDLLKPVKLVTLSDGDWYYVEYSERLYVVVDYGFDRRCIQAYSFFGRCLRVHDMSKMVFPVSVEVALV